MRCVLVHSYKGGTGKSAIAVNLAKYYAVNHGERVLVIEQDYRGCTLEENFEIKPKYYWNDFYRGKSLEKLMVKIENRADIQTGEFHVIFAKNRELNIPSGTNIQEFYSDQSYILKKQIKQLSSTFDRIIFDTSPGFNYEFANDLIVADDVVLVTRISPEEVNKSIQMYDNFYERAQKIGLKRLVIVQNQLPDSIEELYAYQLSDKLERAMKRWKFFIKDKKTVSIPLDRNIANALFRHKCVPLDNPLMDRVAEIAGLLEEQER